jgi:hypothetical protein
VQHPHHKPTDQNGRSIAQGQVLLVESDIDVRTVIVARLHKQRLRLAEQRFHELIGRDRRQLLGRATQIAEAGLGDWDTKHDRSASA